MILKVKNINLDGLVHISGFEKLVSETASQRGFVLLELLNKISLFVLKDDNK